MATVTVEISDMSIFEKFKEMCSRFKEIASVRVEEETAEATPAEVERMLERAFKAYDEGPVYKCANVNELMQELRR